MQAAPLELPWHLASWVSAAVCPSDIWQKAPGCHVPSRQVSLQEEGGGEEIDIDGNRDVWECDDDEGFGYWGKIDEERKLDAVRALTPAEAQRVRLRVLQREDVDRLEGRKECYI
jgi:hypothetical protein